MQNEDDAPKKWGKDASDEQSSFIRQPYPDTCVIRSEELILRDFGYEVNHDQLVIEATQHGWYIPGEGSWPKHVGALLNDYGIPNQQFERANIFTLVSELSQGHRVIVSVDSGELRNRGLSEEFEDLFFEKADHALIVAGIDTRDLDNIQVILTDPGTGDVAKAYPLEQFVEAWKDSNNFMVTTSVAAPSEARGMINFDYEQGHLENVGAIPYEEFVDFYEKYIYDPETESYRADFLGLKSEDFEDITDRFADSVGGRAPIREVEDLLIASWKTHPADEQSDHDLRADPFSYEQELMTDFDPNPDSHGDEEDDDDVEDLEFDD